MARTGITKDDVKDARQRLIDEGQAVTLDSLRIELGNTGSRSTIQRWLRELENDDSTLLYDEQLLTDTLRATVVQLARRLQEEAMVQLEQTKAVHQAAQANWQAISDRLRTQVQDLTEQNERSQHQLSEAEQKNIQLLTSHQQDTLKITTLTGDNAHLKSLLSTKEQHIASLEEKHQHARKALEHYRDSVQTQREQELQRHEHQIQQLQAELRISQQTISVKQQECTTLKEQTLQLSAELHQARQSVKTVEQQLVALQHNHQQAEQQLYRKDMDLAGLHKEFAPLQEQCAAALAQVVSLQQKEQAWLQERAALSASLSTQQQLWQTFSTINAMSTPTQYIKGEDVIVVDADLD
ncbi:TPA: DNA-binding protein [Proteus mirabilis]|nr:DNA-binding protein [Proteus mirabilis]HCT3577360.1 DNA-binding protein [Proteus mirabilis]